MILIYIIFFILGTVVGSFLNVVILRTKTKKSIFKNRSSCPFCKKKLTWYELIPILSFLIQKGKCRNCQKKISLQYPLVEFFTGLIFVFVAAYGLDFALYGFINTIFLLIFSCFLIVIFVYDLKYYLIPDKIIYPAIIITLLYDIYISLVVQDLSFLSSSIEAALIAGGFFLFIILISKGKWMGMGDFKIGILIGLFFGLPHMLIVLFLAFLSGAFVSLILLILKKKTLKSEIPFGPFLSGATFLVLFIGAGLIRWYLSLFI